MGDPRSNPSQGSKADAMKQNLLAQDKIRVMIPVESGSSPTVPFSVTLNGYRLDLPRNQYVSVPEQVAEVIATSHSQTEAALNQFKVGSRKDEGGALT